MMVSAVDNDNDSGGQQPWWILMAVDGDNNGGGSGWRLQWMTSGAVDDDSG
jgi:hypothetical protein